MAPSVPEFTWPDAVCSEPIQPAKATDELTPVPENCHLILTWPSLPRPGKRTSPEHAGETVAVKKY